MFHILIFREAKVDKKSLLPTLAVDTEPKPCGKLATALVRGMQMCEKSKNSSGRGMQTHGNPKNASARGMQARFPLPRPLKASRKLAPPCQYRWEPPASLHSSRKPLGRHPPRSRSSRRAKSGLPTSSQLGFRHMISISI